MALTVNNSNTIALLNILSKNMAAQSNTLKQLTTGSRINSGKDDPAGLIALQNINAELRAVDTSLINNQRTDSMLTVADQAIGEIANLLGEVQTLVQASASSANLTDSEIAANQSQVDDALAAIDTSVVPEVVSWAPVALPVWNATSPFCAEATRLTVRTVSLRL